LGARSRDMQTGDEKLSRDLGNAERDGAARTVGSVRLRDSFGVLQPREIRSNQSRSQQRRVS
jgi:hypothetical protein